MDQQTREIFHQDKRRPNFKPFGIRALIASMPALLAGCRNEPPSSIVRMLEQSGAGDVRSASPESLAKWFGKHNDVLRKTEALCKEVRPHAPANWENLTEGRVCQAAAQVAFFKFTPREGDHRTFGAGKK